MPNRLSIGYLWQTFALVMPIFILFYTLLQSFVDMNWQGFIIFSVVVFATICNELLVSYNILSIPRTFRNNVLSSCGMLNYNKNYYMTNSTIIASFALGYYGLTMHFMRKTNIAFLILLSFILLMDIMFYLAMCGGNGLMLQLGASILYGGVFGITWSSIHNAIYDNNYDKHKRRAVAKAYVNGKEMYIKEIDDLSARAVNVNLGGAESGASEDEVSAAERAILTTRAEKVETFLPTGVTPANATLQQIILAESDAHRAYLSATT